MPMSPRLLRPRSAAIAGDSDVQNYIAAVEIADGQQLEQAVKDAIRDFILGCKTDGIWSAIRASCILMGARTLSGALTPLVGTAPTNNNFVSGDYNRKTGLKGNGSNKSLNTNRNNNTDPQNDFHMAIWGTENPNDTNGFYAGAGADGGGNASGSSYLRTAANALITAGRDATTSFVSGTTRATFTNNMFGVSRSASASYTALAGGSLFTLTVASQSPFNGNILIFAANSQANVPAGWMNNRFAFYSVGASLSLSTLSSRVSTLVTAIGAAIP